MTKAKNEKPEATPAKAEKPVFSLDTVEVVEDVTIPQLKLVNNIPVHVAIRGTFYTGTVLKGADKKEVSVDLVKVENLETREEMEMLCPTEMKTTIETKYKTDFDGRWFRIVRIKEEGKRAVQVKIQEIRASETTEA